MLASLFQDICYTLRLVRKSPGFFATFVALLGLGIGIRFLAGRNFRQDEPPAKPQPIIVNEAFVRRLCPHGDALGRTFGQAWKQPED